MKRLPVLLLLVVLGVGVMPGVASAALVVYPSGTINLPIPDLTTVFDEIIVGDSGVIIDLDVAVVITHTYVGDLIVTLTHVDTGTAVTIMNHQCSSLDSINATFDDEGSALVCPASGSVIPDNPLAAFDGESIGGTWRLTVEDGWGADAGTLVSWALHFEVQGEPGLTIVKDATPGDNTPFAFDCAVGIPNGNDITGRQAAGDCDFMLRDPSDSQEALPAGVYTITELVPAGWRLDNIVCDGGQVRRDGPTLVVSAINEPVTCTYYNSGSGRIIVNKVVSPVDAPAGLFGFVPSWGPGFSLAGGGSHDSGLISAGVYSVSEVLPLAEGWSLASAFCDDNSSPAAIGVSAGETVTCTFNNRYQPPEEEPSGSLTIAKLTVPAGGAGFGFDAGSLGGFTLDHGGSQLFDGLAAGSYTVTETPAAGWEFEDVSCFSAAGTVVNYEVVGAGVMVDLAEGQDVTCRFANRGEDTVGPEGSLTILKVTVPAGGTGFAFDAGALGAFSLDDGGSKVFTDLAAGAYVVTETPAADWEFASVECDALDSVVDGASVTVNLAEGEAAVCTFTNGELPYTGSSLWLPLLLAGLAALLMGLGAWVVGLMKGARA